MNLGFRPAPIISTKSIKLKFTEKDSIESATGAGVLRISKTSKDLIKQSSSIKTAYKKLTG